MFKSNAHVSDNRNAIQEIQPPTCILVIGAGYAGLLFTMRLAGKVARQNVHIALVTQGSFDRFLNKAVATSIRRSLTRLGVEISDHTTIAAVHAHSFVTDQGSEIACDLCLWMGGFVAPPYFTGWLGYQIREIFVRYLAVAPRLERRWPGLFVWPGKRRYEHAQRRQLAKAKQNAIQLIAYNERT